MSLANIIIEAGKKSGTKWQVQAGIEQGKKLIVLKPTTNTEQAYLPNYIIDNVKDCIVLEKVSEIDKISNLILQKSTLNDKVAYNNHQKSLTDF